ncbi:MAG: transketolase [Oligoflexia bacterium]|nr:transketolase [Oligoflexia bacterium]
MHTSPRARKLASISNELRVWIIDMLEAAKSGHPGGSLSAIDLVTALWFDEMRGVDAKAPAAERDRFILSKGHAVPALYAVLAKKGFIAREDLNTLRRTGSLLQGHPDRVRMPIVEASTGSLGQGLSVAQGMALGYKHEGKPTRVYCLIGDGEMQEGQIWEAAMSAPKFELSNLCVILDANNGQIDGPVNEVMPIEPIAEKWRAFGWQVLEINGHDFDQILGALQEARNLGEEGGKKPVFILARTVKGKGVSFMENRIEWHGAAPKAEDARKAREELAREGAALEAVGGKNG